MIPSTDEQVRGALPHALIMILLFVYGVYDITLTRCIILRSHTTAPIHRTSMLDNHGNQVLCTMKEDQTFPHVSDLCRAGTAIPYSCSCWMENDVRLIHS